MKKPVLILTIIIVLAIVLIILFAYKINDKTKLETSNLEQTTNKQEKMEITSSAFTNNARIPAKYTCDGDNINPPIEISEIPENTQSLVLIMDDLDAPKGTWDHWILFNISPSIKKIKEDSVPQGASQALNSWNKNEYGGPCPPSGAHRYFFKLYALNKILDLDENVKKADVEQAIEGDIIQRAELIGLYSKS